MAGADRVHASGVAGRRSGVASGDARHLRFPVRSGQLRPQHIVECWRSSCDCPLSPSRCCAPPYCRPRMRRPGPCPPSSLSGCTTIAPSRRRGASARYRVAGSTAGARAIRWSTTSASNSTAGRWWNLTPNTLYDIRLEAGGRRVEFQARTLQRRVPHRQDHVTCPAEPPTRPLYIREGGTAKGWHLVTPAPERKFVSDVFNLVRLQRRGGSRLRDPARVSN